MPLVDRVRLRIRYESNQGGALLLIANDDEYVVASRQNAPTEAHVAPRADIAMGASYGPFDDLIRGIASRNSRKRSLNRIDSIYASKGEV